MKTLLVIAVLLLSATTGHAQDYYDYGYTVQREGMLACPPGFFMTALNIERNYARCATTGRGMSWDWLTAGSDSANVTECGGSNWAEASVMVRFHKERRVMLCAIVRR